MFKLFLVELALIAHSLQTFNFIIESSVTTYADNLRLCPSSLQDPDQTYIVTFKAQETDAIVHLTTNMEYVDKKFCELMVHPDQIEGANNSTDFMTRSDTTHYATYYYFIKRNSSTWYYIDRVIVQ